MVPEPAGRPAPSAPPRRSALALRARPHAARGDRFAGLRTAGACAGRRASRRGAAALELALTLPIVLFLLSGIVDVGRYLHVAQGVRAAAREGARAGAAVLDPTGSGEVEAVATLRARSALAAVEPACASGCDVVVAWDTRDGLPMLTVAAEAPWEPVVGLVPLLPPRVRAEVTMLTQQAR